MQRRCYRVLALPSLAAAWALSFPGSLTVVARQDQNVSVPGDEKGRQVVAAVLTALGGSRAAGVRSLHLEGQYQDFGEYPLAGTQEVRAVLPHGFLQVATSREVGTTVGWGLRNNSMYRIQGPGVSLLPKDQAAAVERVFEEIFRREATRLLVGVLLTTETPVPVSFAYAGRAKSPDGEADAIDLKWSEDLKARLFVDSRTHLPLMMSFEELRIRSGPAPNSYREIVPRLPEWEKVPHAIYFSDHRRVDGVMVPHQIVTARSGVTQRQWKINSVRVNPKDLLNSFPSPRK